jgi:hypothetical protein
MYVRVFIHDRHREADYVLWYDIDISWGLNNLSKIVGFCGVFVSLLIQS